MTPEVAQRAFEPFFTTKGPGQGTGIGLATVYGVVKEAGGDIKLQSQPGSGTTITVLLPALDQQITRAQVTTTPAAAADGAGRVILLVEDEKEVREVVKRILTGNNYNVIATANAKDALEIITDSAILIDGMLTDVVMPDMSGPQLADRLKHVRPEVPVLLMSGYTAGALPGGTAGSEALPLIRKPFSRAALLQQLQDVLT
jgi:CheY-like chemotaxis protein